jgi:predicted acetyltransferase
VHPSHRGRGLGRALLELAESEAWRAGFDSVYLYTHEKMADNLALYARIGFVEYKRRSQGDFSLVFMRKHLAESGAQDSGHPRQRSAHHVHRAVEEDRGRSSGGAATRDNA